MAVAPKRPHIRGSFKGSVDHDQTMASVETEMRAPVLGFWDMGHYIRQNVHPVARAVDALHKPYICAVNGTATGAGLDMALMTDIRYAARSARFAETYIKVGLVPGDGGAFLLPRLVGLTKALELLWSGDFISAEEAERIGLLSKVFDDEQLMNETYAF